MALDLDNPDFLAGLWRLRISVGMDAAKAQGGPVDPVKGLVLTAGASVTLGRRYLMRPQRHELPAEIRIAPAW